MAQHHVEPRGERGGKRTNELLAFLTEMARAIFGADPPAAGTIAIDGEPVKIRSPSDAIRLGIGLVPEDRKQQALFLQQAIRSNFSIASLGHFLRAGIFVDERKEQA